MPSVEGAASSPPPHAVNMRASTSAKPPSAIGLLRFRLMSCTLVLVREALIIVGELFHIGYHAQPAGGNMMRLSEPTRQG